MPRRITKQLTCPACGVVIAEATYQRFPGNLTLTDPDGAYLAPETAGTQERRAQTAIAQAGSPAEEERARDRLEFAQRNVGELIYELRCRNGHSFLRTMPQLVRAVRDSTAQWVDVG